jgi:hypothetical protein
MGSVTRWPLPASAADPAAPPTGPPALLARPEATATSRAQTSTGSPAHYRSPPFRNSVGLVCSRIRLVSQNAVQSLLMHRRPLAAIGQWFHIVARDFFYGAQTHMAHHHQQCARHFRRGWHTSDPSPCSGWAQTIAGSSDRPSGAARLCCRSSSRGWLHSEGREDSVD